jgi:hypothetical protein
LGAVACAAVGATTACLPRGDPPAGRQVIADRSAYLTGIVPPTSDGVLRLLVARISADGARNDLYVVSVPDTGPPSERLLVADLPSGVPCSPRASGFLAVPCYPTDARGRLYLHTSSDPYQGTQGIARIDPVTGERLDLGDGRYFVMSRTRDRVLVVRESDATLYENDGQATQLAGVYQGYAQFVGEDLFYVVSEQGLMHVPPHGVPELVRAGVTDFYEQKTDTGPLLDIFITPGAGAGAATSSILDPVTLQDLFTPIENDPISVSPDRRWLLVEHNDRSLTFIDGVTADREDFAPHDVGMQFTHEWRPGHAEVWFLASVYDPDSPPSAVTWIKAPGKPAITVPLFAEGLYDVTRGRSFQSIFTSDGAYWFSHPASIVGRPAIQIGPADDPGAAGFDFNPGGTYNGGYQALADGRLLVSAYYTDFQRSDISAIDPATGATQLLGEQGTVLVVGQRRVLANLHMIDGSGDLTAIDLADGHSTLLAAEFTYVAFIESQRRGDAEQGARVAFQFRARFDSPYDGIWVTALP